MEILFGIIVIIMFALGFHFLHKPAPTVEVIHFFFSDSQYRFAFPEKDKTTAILELRDEPWEIVRRQMRSIGVDPYTYSNSPIAKIRARENVGRTFKVNEKLTVRMEVYFDPVYGPRKEFAPLG